MNTKTARQIEEMKKQTIGVEIEMNSISRSKAAKLASQFFGTGRYKTQQTATATAHTRLGTSKAESGNSKKMLALQELTVRNAKWSHQF